MLYYTYHATQCNTMPYHNAIPYYTMFPQSPGALVGFFALQATPTETLCPGLGPVSGTRGWRGVCRSTPRTVRFAGHHALAEPLAASLEELVAHCGPGRVGDLPLQGHDTEARRVCALQSWEKQSRVGPQFPRHAEGARKIGIHWILYA